LIDGDGEAAAIAVFNGHIADAGVDEIIPARASDGGDVAAEEADIFGVLFGGGTGVGTTDGAVLDTESFVVTAGGAGVFGTIPVRLSFEGAFPIWGGSPVAFAGGEGGEGAF
jgi:hypothetical protein